MPTYEYICRACNHTFEAFQPITADPIRVCPRCGARKVERKIGIGAGILFKGGGFYETDYRSEAYTKAAEAERKSTTSDGAKSGATDESASTSKDSAKPAPERAAAPPSAAKPKAESGKPAAEKPSRDKPADSDRASNATHPSRVGRGIGNIVQRPPSPKRGGRKRGG